MGISECLCGEYYLGGGVYDFSLARDSSSIRGSTQEALFLCSLLELEAITEDLFPPLFFDLLLLNALTEEARCSTTLEQLFLRDPLLEGCNSKKPPLFPRHAGVGIKFSINCWLFPS